MGSRFNAPRKPAFHECNGEWEKIIDFMKQRVMMLPGDYLKKSKTNEYYQTATSKAAIKILQRIVNQSVKKASDPFTSSQTSSASHIPSAHQTPSAVPPSMATVIRQSKERYSKKSTPEERRASAKFSHTVHLDSCSSESEVASRDDVAAGTEIVVKTETARGQKRRKHHGRGKREKTAASEANKAHTEMCTKAMKMMDRIDMVSDKYESSESD